MTQGRAQHRPPGLTITARGGLPIAAVAQACGFADQAHLTRQFRVAKGSTPRAFRLAVRD